MKTLLFAAIFGISAAILTTEAPGQCVGGACFAAPPPVIYGQRIIYEPFQYQGSTVIYRQPWTPIRSFFGIPRPRIQHRYGPPQQPQQHQSLQPQAAPQPIPDSRSGRLQVQPIPTARLYGIR